MEIEEKVPYIVQIKEKYLKNMSESSTGIKFCGFLVNNTDGNFYFNLNGSRMLVIVPHYFIETMYPSKVHFKLLKGEKENYFEYNRSLY